ncbi:MAG: hypothetical protein ACRDN0_03915 [Trebonia sp.]
MDDDPEELRPEGALGADRDAQVRVVRSVWTAGGEPAAISTAYVREHFAASLGTGAQDVKWPEGGSADPVPPGGRSPGDALHRNQVLGRAGPVQLPVRQPPDERAAQEFPDGHIYFRAC